MELTAKNVKSIIDKYIGLYDKIVQQIDYVIADKKYYFSDVKAPAALIGPIDGKYGLYLNVRDYILNDEEIVTPIILHELVHYQLLLDNKQSENNQHDENFQKLAEKIEKLTNIEGVKYGENKVHEFLKYRNKTFFPIIIENENGVFITRIYEKNKNYWKKYLYEGTKIGQFKGFKIPQPTNRKIFEDVPLTTNIDSLNCIEYSENVYHLNY